MKKIYILLSFFIGNFAYLYAQPNPIFTQYITNPYTINSAISGMRNETDFKFTYRQSSLGIEGAPQSVFFTANTGILQKGAKQNAPFKHGFGIRVLNDQAGLLKRSSVLGNYAFHLPINEETYVSAGMSFGFQSFFLDEKRAIVKDPTDPVANTAFNANALEGDISAMLYSSNYFLGVSSNVITPSQTKWVNDVKIDRVHNITAGYKYQFAEDKFALMPSILVRMIGGQLVYDGNFMVKMRQFTDRYRKNIFDAWAGVTYRANDGIAFLVGGSYNSLNGTFSYDYFKKGLNGYYEFTIGLKIPKKNTKLAKKSVQDKNNVPMFY